MKLAVLASEDSLLPLFPAISDPSRHDIIAFWSPDQEHFSTIQDRFPAAKRLNNWDELLTDSAVDWILVVADSGPIVSASRQLVQAQKSLLVATWGADPASVFEYTALWQDAPDQIFPLFHSGVGDLSERLVNQYNDDFGVTPWRVEFHRTATTPSSSPSLDMKQIRHWLLQDLSWLHTLEPNAAQVTMMTTGPDAEKPVEANVTLSNPGSVELRWKLQPGSADEWNLTVIGGKGQLSLRCDASGRLHSTEFDVQEADAAETTAAQRDLDSQLKRVETSDRPLDWNDVIRFGEIGAAAQRSLARKRTVTVQFEDASERSQFKSQMTAIGCGSLLWAMFGMIGLLVAGAAIDPRDREYLTSASAGYVIEENEFVANSPQLDPLGQEHLARIRKTWSSVSPILVIESNHAESEELDQQRASSIIAALGEEGLTNVKSRIVVRSIQGKWFETVMLIGWVVVFLPIGLVLIAQLMIVIARPLE